VPVVVPVVVLPDRVVGVAGWSCMLALVAPVALPDVPEVPVTGCVGCAPAGTPVDRSCALLINRTPL
jgi:hypothetical protein